jgi:hypothetical protein
MPSSKLTMGPSSGTASGVSDADAKLDFRWTSFMPLLLLGTQELVLAPRHEVAAQPLLLLPFSAAFKSAPEYLLLNEGVGEILPPLTA